MKKHFFNQSLKFFKEHKIKKVILALSGGLDSVVLLDLIKELSRPLKLKVFVAHIHHGPSPKASVKNYRAKAYKFTQHLSQSYGLEFLSPPPSLKALKSEQELRDFRHHNLKKLLKQKKADFIALAHNKEDLLETQLIQLIRGCGAKGLTSLKAWDPPKIRPLLFWSRKDITLYAQQQNLKWLEDPTNQNTAYLRNWIRKKWLPELEHHRKGSINSLARSLQTLSLQTSSLQVKPPCKTPKLKIISKKGIHRRAFIELPLSEQKNLLAFYMREELKLKNYAQSHIQELLKHAERREKSFSVKLLKKTWCFTSDFIKAKE